MEDFKGRHALVTGAASGIGRATALALAKRGANLTILDLNLKGVEETAAQVAREGVKVAALPLDVSDPAAVSAAMRKAEETSGTPDYLVNAAGAFFAGPDRRDQRRSSAQVLLDQRVRRDLHVPRAVARHEPSRQRRHRQHLLATRAERPARRMALRRREGRGDGLHPVARARKSGNLHPRQRGRARPIDTPFWRNAMVGDDATAAIARRVKSIPKAGSAGRRTWPWSIVFAFVGLGLHDGSGRRHRRREIMP